MSPKARIPRHRRRDDARQGTFAFPRPGGCPKCYATSWRLPRVAREHYRNVREASAASARHLLALVVRGSSEIRGPLAIACAREAGALLSALSGWGSFVEQMRGETQEQASLAAAAPEGVP